jgi:hypothetical protein
MLALFDSRYFLDSSLVSAAAKVGIEPDFNYLSQ